MEESYHKHYEKCIQLLKDLIAPSSYKNIGFFASSYEKDNYKRLFTRDAFWIFMASILSQDRTLLNGCRESLRTLLRYQREDGAIPSNVSSDGKVSYGIINPRIDPTSLYIIACSRFAKRYPREKIEKSRFLSIEKAMHHLERSWQHKKHKLLYIPRSGNWADEYLQQGFVLYDEALWYLALREFSDILLLVGDKRHIKYWRMSEEVKKVILEKFWVKSLPEKDAISKRVLEKLRDPKTGYFIHYFYSPSREKASFRNPCGIFDAFGNILAMLAGIVPPDKLNEMINFIDRVSVNKYPLIPAHYPLFPEETFRSPKLHQYRFKQFIGHYHNGGLWAWYTGPYVAALVKSGEKKKAEAFLCGIMKANSEKKNGMNFYEYHRGKRAIGYLKVKNDEGINVSVSTHIGKIARMSRSMVLFHFNKEKADVEDDLALRALNVHKKDLVKVSAVGPDSEEVIREISELREGNGKKAFHRNRILLKGSSPGGVPSLGVSAAAFIIAYKAFFEEKVIFEEWC